MFTVRNTRTAPFDLIEVGGVGCRGRPDAIRDDAGRGRTGTSESGLGVEGNDDLVSRLFNSFKSSQNNIGERYLSDKSQKFKVVNLS
jgi:hypothetical protein